MKYTERAAWPTLVGWWIVWGPPVGIDEFLVQARYTKRQAKVLVQSSGALVAFIISQWQMRRDEVVDHI